MGYEKKNHFIKKLERPESNTDPKANSEIPSHLSVSPINYTINAQKGTFVLFNISSTDESIPHARIIGPHKLGSHLFSRHPKTEAEE